MDRPTIEDVRRLAEWRPPLGVISVYLRFDPADRGGAWRTELRNGLAGVLGGADDLDHDTRKALRATAERVAERFADDDRALPRGEVGFVEVAADPGSDRWWSTHISPESAATVCFGERPVVSPLLCIVERGAPRGIALVSAERVHLLEWQPGRLEGLHAWELNMFSRGWREGKAQTVPDPARAQAVSASGHDQYANRLDDNRRRFLGECRHLAERAAAERGWAELLTFGAPHHVECFREGTDSSSPIVAGADADLISTPLGELVDPVEQAVERRAAEHQRQLVERVVEEARGGIRGTLGLQETLAALDDGRVDRLIVDVALAAEATSSAAPGGEGAAPGVVNGAEALVRSALASAAEIATVSGEAAELLSDADGVAALLRY